MVALTDIDKICLDCPLNECNEDDPNCSYWQVRGHGRHNRWADLQKRLREARPGCVITLRVSCDDIECAEKAARRVRKVHVKNIRDGEGWLMTIEPAEASCAP